LLSKFRQALRKFIYIVSEVFILITIIILYVKAGHKSKISNAAESVFGIFAFVLVLNFLLGLLTCGNFKGQTEEDDPAGAGSDDKNKQGQDNNLNKVQTAPDLNQTGRKLQEGEGDGPGGEEQKENDGDEWKTDGGDVKKATDKGTLDGDVEKMKGKADDVVEKA